jgi:hypothetical protein
MRRFAPFIVVLILVGCTPSTSPSPTGETGVLEVRVVAGPVCPVETIPPDPACEPRRVGDARVFVSPGDGRDIVLAEGVTDDDGIVRLTLPPGDYIVAGGEVDGFFGLPEPTPATVLAGESTDVTLAYDTGIR